VCENIKRKVNITKGEKLKHKQIEKNKQKRTQQWNVQNLSKYDLQPDFYIFLFLIVFFVLFLASGEISLFFFVQPLSFLL
jgi:hypothetical protein